MQEASSYIRNDFEPFDYETTLATVQDFFLEHSISHFPVVEKNFYMGCIAQNDVDTFDFQKKIKDYAFVLDTFFIRKDKHWLDILEIFAKNETQIVPVLDDQNQYIGYYELNDMMRFFNETPFLHEPGNLLIIEKQSHDFSMSQITQIIESNNGKLLGLFVSESTNQSVQITVKLMLGGINEIIQSFRRYGYDIISRHEEDSYLLNLKERSDYLTKYLDL